MRGLSSSGRFTTRITPETVRDSCSSAVPSIDALVRLGRFGVKGKANLEPTPVEASHWLLLVWGRMVRCSLCPAQAHTMDYQEVRRSGAADGHRPCPKSANAGSSGEPLAQLGSGSYAYSVKGQNWGRSPENVIRSSPCFVMLCFR